MITLTARDLAQADRDDYHARAMAELGKPSPDVREAAYLFWLASQHALRTNRQRLEVVGLAFAVLPRASRAIANPWEVDR